MTDRELLIRALGLCNQIGNKERHDSGLIPIDIQANASGLRYEITAHIKGAE